jgi:hypothetical protein
MTRPTLAAVSALALGALGVLGAWLQPGTVSAVPGYSLAPMHTFTQIA